MAETITLGKVSVSPKGAYSSTASYTFLDTVSHNGGAFLCLQNSTGVEPGVSSGWQSYWMVTGQGIKTVEITSPETGKATITVTLSDGTQSSITIDTAAIGTGAIGTNELADGAVTAEKLAPGAGIPLGGTKGQVLMKDSDADGDVQWNNVALSGSGAPSGEADFIGQLYVDDVNNAPYVQAGYVRAKTATGEIVSVTDATPSTPIISLTADIEPIQSGSGSPSESNIRPLEGTTEVKIAVSGKNLIRIGTDNIYSQQYIDITPYGNGWSMKSTQAYGRVGYLFSGFKVGGTYTLSMLISRSVSSGSNTSIYLNDKGDWGGNVRINIYGSDGITPEQKKTVTFTTSTGEIFIGFYVSAGDSYPDVISVTDIQLEEGDTASSYEPYQAGSTYSIDWSSLAGVVYGGVVDVISGRLTVTQGYIASYSGQTLPGAWISDRDVYVAGATPTTGAQVVYELASPQTYSLPQTEISTLPGTTIIQANTGDVSVTYQSPDGEPTTPVWLLLSSGVKMVKLWENASPSSEFAAQTVPIDFSGYEYFGIYSWHSPDTHQGTFHVGKVGDILLINTNDAYSSMRRNATCLVSGLTFTDLNVRTFSNGVYSTNNSLLVPHTVFGIKGVK